MAHDPASGGEKIALIEQMDIQDNTVKQLSTRPACMEIGKANSKRIRANCDLETSRFLETGSPGTSNEDVGASFL
jgi:hypothetical protein